MSSSFGIPNDRTGGDVGGEFDSFRRKRQNRKYKTEGISDSAAPISNLQRAIETEERKEIFERQIAREVQDFVEETTRIAARILSEVGKEKEQVHSEHIHDDMREFFQVTLSRAEAMLNSMRAMAEGNGPAVSEIEAHLQNLATATLDQFRSEGSQRTRDLHLGERPAEMPVEVPHEQHDDEAHLSVVREEGWTELDEQAEVDEVADSQVHLAPIEDEFGYEDAEEDGGSAKASGAWRAVRDDEPTEAEDEILVESDDDPFQPDAPVEDEARSPAADAGTDDGFPAFFAKWRHDPARLKKALTVMVKNGLMTSDEAREIFRKA